MRSRTARAAGLHYLEHEAMELKMGDKTWKIYGSPVSLLHSKCLMCTSDFVQSAPRFMPGSFQYKDRAGAEGKGPWLLHSLCSKRWL